MTASQKTVRVKQWHRNTRRRSWLLSVSQRRTPEVKPQCHLLPWAKRTFHQQRAVFASSSSLAPRRRAQTLPFLLTASSSPKATARVFSYCHTMTWRCWGGEADSARCPYLAITPSHHRTSGHIHPPGPHLASLGGKQCSRFLFYCTL